MKNIAVIGSGTMGNGIAHVFAQSGYQVNLIDISQEQLDKALGTIERNLDRLLAKERITQENKETTLGKITTHTDTEAARDADLVVEAATENEGIKLSIFKNLDAICKPETILASNTSSIPITKIGAATKRPEKVIGMHFMNPVPIMKLVEVINGKETSVDTTQKVMDLSKDLGKIPVEVNDFPGFVANRILMPMINEAILSLEEGVSGVEEIDTVMKIGMAHPMGPLQLADFIGLDVCLSIMEVLHEGFNNSKYAPSQVLQDLVKEGDLGVKSGQGFYAYEKGSKELKVAPQFSENSHAIENQ
ncbi:MAG TPA: 3-hydroxybutyryl-CoA dehydrogenase [Flavobacteriales bacterium]|nr:3-hydroxybutyryl-CoA dehydrogenase [Flavobacteriales bacterium]HIN40424.1 3-hydroxybutyryl-CoA dehydrogenase [Flavobacteriales bacterium]